MEVRVVEILLIKKTLLYEIIEISGSQMGTVSDTEQPINNY